MPTVVMVNAPDSLLAERRRIGSDTGDEMWDGVIHLVPPAGSRHGTRQLALGAILLMAMQSTGWTGGTEIGVFRPGRGDDYRVPDLAFAPPEVISERGIDGVAALVVEIRSPGDESWQKLDFYGDVGVIELLIIDAEAQTTHLLRNRDGRMVEQQPGDRGEVRLQSLGVALRFDGDVLVVHSAGAVHRL